MANAPVITTPADYSTQATPFTVSGTSDGRIVEVRDVAGLLLPASQNPAPVVNSTWSMSITSFNGNRGGLYAYSSGDVTVATGITMVGTIASGTKTWGTNRTASIEAFTAGGSELLIAWTQAEVEAATTSSFVFNTPGVTWNRVVTRHPLTPAGLIEVWTATPTAGTYSGTVNLPGTGNCDVHTFISRWSGVARIGATGTFDAGAVNGRATGILNITGTNSVILAGFIHTDGQTNFVLNDGVTGSNCTLLASDLNGPTHNLIRVVGAVSSGSYNVGIISPNSLAWSLSAIELQSQ